MTDGYNKIIKDTSPFKDITKFGELIFDNLGKVVHSSFSVSKELVNFDYTKLNNFDIIENTLGIDLMYIDGFYKLVTADANLFVTEDDLNSTWTKK